MAVDFKTFVSVVPHVTAVRKPVLVRGRHGVGKRLAQRLVGDGLRPHLRRPRLDLLPAELNVGGDEYCSP